MNEQSSRSHFVFTLRISGVNEVLYQPNQLFCFLMIPVLSNKPNCLFTSSDRALSNKYKGS